MTRGRSKGNGAGAIQDSSAKLSFEAKLWQAANALRYDSRPAVSLSGRAVHYGGLLAGRMVIVVWTPTGGGWRIYFDEEGQCPRASALFTESENVV
jgi:hypothetical protein